MYKLQKLIAGIKGLPEYTAVLEEVNETIYGMHVLNEYHHSHTAVEHTHSTIQIYEGYAGWKIISKFTVSIDDNCIYYRNKEITLEQALKKIQKAMRRYHGKPINGVYIFDLADSITG